jgi:hypothetical protein
MKKWFGQQQNPYTTNIYIYIIKRNAKSLKMMSFYSRTSTVAKSIFKTKTIFLNIAYSKQSRM